MSGFEKQSWNYNLLCEIVPIRDMVKTQLFGLGGNYHSSSLLCFIVDLPPGFALQLLETQKDSESHYIVITLNKCLEYCEMLELQGASVVISGMLAEKDLVEALNLLSCRQVTRDRRESSLTPTEIRFLYLISKGLTNQQIEQICSTTPQYIRNATSRILSKLQITHRSEAILYFWGHLSNYNSNPDELDEDI
ncbi:MAG: hypothetical protein GFH27_549287n282 [Chloroflexi bacterium AL-W]|nr:hypothetical protein [Chloroflexi bacterium AL-N1]NOK66556.1 hypothetical protein [Chloroflexi bacterium AL-N10]NOK71944.1 hypothetical protein [Chloroflexi bacterium AL-N5]NOK81201.1 hypothetical protein [Chloroflexi bacterium AL-W]NOK89474.1 hypothetical protein [Chloroflexi bacterium AL-N15]